jgi:hypothetical protein
MSVISCSLDGGGGDKCIHSGGETPRKVAIWKIVPCMGYVIKMYLRETGC